MSTDPNVEAIVAAVHKGSPASVPSDYLCMEMRHLFMVLKKYSNVRQRGVLESSSRNFLALLGDIEKEQSARKRTRTPTAHTPSPRKKARQRQSPVNKQVKAKARQPARARLSLKARSVDLDVAQVRSILTDRRGTFHRQGSVAADKLLAQVNARSSNEYTLASLEVVLNELQEKNSLMYSQGTVHSV